MVPRAVPTLEMLELEPSVKIKWVIHLYDSPCFSVQAWMEN